MSSCASSDAKPAGRSVELADVLAHHGNEFLKSHRIPPRHLKVMRAIVNCRTAALGGHRRWCDACDYQKYVYHSCRNRHCPKCQTQAKEAWRNARQLELLPVPYFHQVFTLPHELNPWVLAGEENQRALLKLLFDAASATLLEFGRGEFGGKVGFTLVLHTWDQQLRPHFHLHGLIAAGALCGDGDRWVAGGNKFLFPVRAISKMFRGKFLSGLEQLYVAGKLKRPRSCQSESGIERRLLRQLSKKSWVVYSKAPFAGPSKLLDYLSRYTHRVAISNDRLVSCRDGHVTFDYRDRRDGDRRKQMKLPAKQFIGRFLTHVLPSGFMRIRHYGFLTNRYRKTRLHQIRKLLGAREPLEHQAQTAEQWLAETLGIDPSACPCCGAELQVDDLRPALPILLRQFPSRLSRAPPKLVQA
jgi:hypothetical protein